MSAKVIGRPFKKGDKRPENSGRKVGSKNKDSSPLTLDLVKTLREMGHDPAAFQVEICVEAMKRYRAIMKTKGKFGAASALHVAERANAELLKYIYPTRKAVEGTNGEAITLKSIIEILAGEEIDE